MKKPVVLIAAALLLVSCASKPPSSLVTPLPPVQQPLPTKPQQSQEPMRGVWLATVSRLDWPPVASVNVSSPALRITQQQEALKGKLDKLKSLGINTVFFRLSLMAPRSGPLKYCPGQIC